MTIARSPIGRGAIAGPVTGAAPADSSYTVTLPIAIAVGDERVFEVRGKTVYWSAIVTVAGQDVSDRLRGQLTIRAAEDSAREASFSLIPISAAQLAAIDGAPVTIDIVLRTVTSYAVYRRFTGHVDQPDDFDPATRTVTLHCRDGYQERPKACKSAAEVQALLGGKAAVCDGLVAWSDAAPSPASYFSGLLDTLPGAVAIDGSGRWQVIDWSIGAPAATFGPGDIIDGSLRVRWSAKADLPAAVTASLTLRYNRLHQVVVPVTWDGLSYSRIGLDGCTWPTRAAVTEALSGLQNWHVRGAITFGMLAPGAYPMIHDGTSTNLLISETYSQTYCNHADATMFSRWYQEVDRKYTITISLAGSSDRDESINEAISSAWSGGSDWEKETTSPAASDIYAANAPGSSIDADGDGIADVLEAVAAPYPPDNGALDYCPDVDPSGAVAHVAAKALRKAAQGLRDRRVSFDRVIDPRWELGAILAVSSDGVSAVGQLSEFEETLDHESGTCIGTYYLSVPAGNATTTGITVTGIPPLSNTVAHAISAPALQNWVGASQTTLANPDIKVMSGHLTNVTPQADSYSAAAPVYVEQFRVVMPELAAEVRDPLTDPAAVTVTWHIAAGSLTIDFEGA